MNDEKVIKAVAQAAKEQGEDDMRYAEYDSYCIGRAGPPLGPVGDEPTADERALLEALFAPPSKKDVNVYADVAIAAFAQKSQAPATPQVAPGVASLDARREAKAQAAKCASTGFKTKSWLLAAGILALIAGGLLFGLRRGDREVTSLGYQMEILGGDKAVRSASEPTAAKLKLRPASEVEIVFRPENTVAQGPLSLGAFVVSGGAVERWNVPYETTPEGVVRIVGTASELGLKTVGEARLVFAIGSTDLVSSLESSTVETALRGPKPPRIAGLDVFTAEVELKASEPQ